MTAREIIATLEAVAPLSLQEGFDNAGIQVGSIDLEVTGCLVCLDITPEVIDEAIAMGYNMVVSHHPIIFGGIKQITGATHVDRCIIRAIRHDIVLYSAHTNMDKAFGGVNYCIGRKIGLTDLQTLAAEDADGCVGLGVVGELSTPVFLVDYLKQVKSALGIHTLRYSSTPDRLIRRVALCGGSGSSLYTRAKAKGADLFLSAEIKHHEFFEATDCFTLADFGHYESEQVIKELFCEIITNKMPNFAVRIANASVNPIKYI